MLLPEPAAGEHYKMQVARYRERHSTLGEKSDAADAHLLAEIVRVDRAHHRPVAGDSEIAEHVKVAERAHQGMIWSRVRQVNTLRSLLREYYELRWPRLVLIWPTGTRSRC